MLTRRVKSDRYDAINVTIFNLFINHRMLQATVCINEIVHFGSALNATKFQLHGKKAYSGHTAIFCCVQSILAVHNKIRLCPYPWGGPI